MICNLFKLMVVFASSSLATADFFDTQGDQ